MSVYKKETVEYSVEIVFKHDLTEEESDPIWCFITKYPNYSELDPSSLLVKGFKKDTDAVAFNKAFRSSFSNLIK